MGIPGMTATFIVPTWLGRFTRQAAGFPRRKFERRYSMLATSQKRAGPNDSFNMRVELPQRQSVPPILSARSAAPLWTAWQTNTPGAGVPAVPAAPRSMRCAVAPLQTRQPFGALHSVTFAGCAAGDRDHAQPPIVG